MISFQAPLGCQRNGAHEVSWRWQTHLGASRLLVEYLLLAVLRTVHDMVLAPKDHITINKIVSSSQIFSLKLSIIQNINWQLTTHLAIISVMSGAAFRSECSLRATES